MTASTSAASLIAFGKRHRAALAIAVLLVFPWLMPYEALAVNILVLGLYAVGFNLLFGYTGLLSFGHAAFLGSGAYGCGIALVHFGVPWFGSILIGVLLSAFFAAIMGFLAIRTRGIYFAMVTLALSQCVYYLFYQAVNLTGGENGLRGINLSEIGILGFSVNFLNPTNKYYVILAFVAFCGLAGALKALHLSIVPIETLHYLTSGQVVMMALLGGMNTFFGPFVGAAAFLLLEDVLTTMTSHWQLVLGAVFVIFVLFFPKGIWGSALSWMVRK